MCLIVVSWRAHPDYPLVVTANRDEFYTRPTAEAGFWDDVPTVIAGRDLEAGGTWLGVTHGGRFAAVTNVRESGAGNGVRSRGWLTRDFLAGQKSAADYVAGIPMAQYSGFNLLIGDNTSLWYCSNRGAAPQELTAGIYGVSNHLLDSPWPKLLSARQRTAQALATLPDCEPLFKILADDEIVPDAELPDTGVPLEWERLLSAIFVRSETYGTRASTVVVQAADGAIRVEERSFGPGGQPLQSSLISTGV